MAKWLTFNLVDCTADRLMSLLRFLKSLVVVNPAYCFLHHKVVQKAANIEVATLLEKKRAYQVYHSEELRAKIGQYADHG